MEIIKVIKGAERRRRYTAQEKQALVEEGLEPGNSFSSVARKHGISPSLIFNWRKLMKQGQIAAIECDENTIGVSELKRAQNEIRQLQRLIGKQAMHIDILKEAVSLAREKKLISRQPLLGVEGFE